MQSFWKRQSSWFGAVVLGAAASGALMGASGDASTVVTRAITAGDVFGGAYASLSENGGGTATTEFFAYVSPTALVGYFGFPTTDYTIAGEVSPPGQSGHADGTGTGHFTFYDVYAFDPMQGGFVGPFVIDFDLSVDGASDGAGAIVAQGVTAQVDPMTGEFTVVRQHIVGNQAWGATAGAITISADDGSGPYVTGGTGVFGMMEADTIHTVQQIH